VVLRTEGQGSDPGALGVDVAQRLLVGCGGAMLLDDAA
jgi:hypothetical protein